MDEDPGLLGKEDLMRRATEVSLRLFLLAALGIWCFLIFQPFIELVVWGIILAVALNPVFTKMTAALGGRRSLAGGIFIAVGIGLVALPTWFLSESFYEGVQWLTDRQASGPIEIPPPPASIESWPVIGSPLYDLWADASRDLQAVLVRFGPELARFASSLVSTISGVGIGLLVTIAAIVVAGLMLMHAEGGAREARAVGERLADEQGGAAIDLAVESIRSVAMGVVGVAAVQSVLAGVGLFMADVPLAGLWAVLVLILAVAQLPPLIVLGPAIAFVIATSDSTVTQIVFTIWSLMVSVSDSFLKPMFLGRGMNIPMPVILIGAIGGMLRSGIVGLFVGAVVMAVGYSIFMAWMQQRQGDASSPQSEAA